MRTFVKNSIEERQKVRYDKMTLQRGKGGGAMLGAAAIPVAFGYLAARTTFALLPGFVAVVAAAIFLLQWRVDSSQRR